MILKNVFSPIRVGKMEIANRLVVAPMVTQYCNSDGTASDRWIAYHEAKAKGGWGLIITEDFAVDPLGRGFSCVPGLWDDAQIESHSGAYKSRPPPRRQNNGPDISCGQTNKSAGYRRPMRGAFPDRVSGHSRNAARIVRAGHSANRRKVRRLRLEG